MECKIYDWCPQKFDTSLGDLIIYTYNIIHIQFIQYWSKLQSNTELTFFFFLRLFISLAPPSSNVFSTIRSKSPQISRLPYSTCQYVIIAIYARKRATVTNNIIISSHIVLILWDCSEFYDPKCFHLSFLIRIWMIPSWILWVIFSFSFRYSVFLCVSIKFKAIKREQISILVTQRFNVFIVFNFYKLVSNGINHLGLLHIFMCKLHQICKLLLKLSICNIHLKLLIIILCPWERSRCQFDGGRIVWTTKSIL